MKLLYLHHVFWEIIPSTLPVCASWDIPTTDSDILEKRRDVFEQWHYSTTYQSLSFLHVYSKSSQNDRWFTWIWGVLHCNHEHRRGRQINIGWDSPLPPSGTHYKWARKRKRNNLRDHFHMVVKFVVLVCVFQNILGGFQSSLEAAIWEHFV